MNKEELLKAIDETKYEIEWVKQELETCNNLRYKQKLKQILKELQYKQLWHLESLERLK